MQNYCVRRGYTPECAKRLNKDVDGIDSVVNRFIETNSEAKKEYINLIRMKNRRKKRTATRGEGI